MNATANKCIAATDTEQMNCTTVDYDDDVTAVDTTAITGTCYSSIPTTPLTHRHCPHHNVSLRSSPSAYVILYVHTDYTHSVVLVRTGRNRLAKF